MNAFYFESNVDISLSGLETGYQMQSLLHFNTLELKPQCITSTVTDHLQTMTKPPACCNYKNYDMIKNQSDF